MKVWFPTIRTGSGSDVFTLCLAQGLLQSGVETVVTWFPHYMEFVPDLLRSVRAPSGTDVIHANSWAGFAFRRAGIPLVVTTHHCVHDKDFAPYRSVLQAIYHAIVIRPYERRSFAEASAMTAVSAFTAQRIAEYFPGTTPFVIHNGVDTEFFRPANDVQTASERPFRLLFVGNPTRRKGFEVALAVMARIDPRHFELCHTSGLRGYTGAIRPGVRRLGKLNRRQLLRAYQDCDALLFPSRYEGFGYAICEAMACGKPVIAADQGPTREIILDKVTGILCPADDISAFVRAVCYLAENRQMGQDMGSAGRQRVCEHFTLDRMVARYRGLYEQLSG